MIGYGLKIINAAENKSNKLAVISSTHFLSFRKKLNSNIQIQKTTKD